MTELMNWNQQKRCWIKMKNGKLFTISCKKLGFPLSKRTKAETCEAANSWWRSMNPKLEYPKSSQKALMNWDMKNKSWRRMFEGQEFRIHCRQLGLPHCAWTKSGSVKAANEWWLSLPINPNNININQTLEDFPELLKQFHPTKNNNLKPKNIKSLSSKKIWWQCEAAEDHEWQATTCNRTGRYENGTRINKGSTCPFCCNKKICHSNCLAIICPTIAIEWHPTKNGNLTPYDVTTGSHIKVWWKCSKQGHEWETFVRYRAQRGTNCHICKFSKGEEKIRLYLKSNLTDDEWKSQFATKIDRPDFVLTKQRTILEYNGEQHYYPRSFGSKELNAGENKLEDNIRRDNRKLQRSVNKKIPLLIIPYWDQDRITEILDDFFAGKNPTFTEPPEIVKKHEPMRKMIRDRLKITEPEILCGLIK